MLNGSASSDLDGDTLTFLWTGPFGTNNTVTPTVAMPIGTSTVTLEVSDGLATTTATVDISVVDTTAPETTLTSSSPLSPNPVGDATFEFVGDDAGSGLAGFECQLNSAGYSPCSSPREYSGLSNGNYTFAVRAVDNAGNVDSSPATQTWTVQLNTAPVIDSPSTVSVSENQLGALDVQATDDYDAEGAGNGLAFTKSGADASIFTLDTNTGLLTFINAPDFEMPGDSNADNTYELEVTVTDSAGLPAAQTIEIAVVNELDGTYTELSATPLSSGLLILQGTSAADQFVVTGTGPGSVSITDGANDGAPVGNFNNLTGLRLNGKQGVNHFTLRSVNIPATLEINSGGSDDKVLIEESLSVGGLDIDLAGGNNMITTADLNVTIAVAGSANIETNQGVDMVVIPNITTDNHFDIDLRGGNDTTELGVGGTVMIGNRLTVNSGYGDNTAVLEGVQVINVVQLFSGNGMDDYEISNMNVGGFMDVLAGAGNDGVVSDSNYVAGEYNVNCGPGDQDSFVSSNDQGDPLVHNQCEIVP